MVYFPSVSAIGYIWATLGLVWLVGAAFTKRTLHSQPTGPRLFQIAIAILGFTLVGSERMGGGWLGQHFLTPSLQFQIAGLILTFAGCAFAIWARITLGGNWSGRATVKENHELIVRGPYALARHPIYTGLFIAALGTTLAALEWRCALGMVLITVLLVLKISQEEKLMMQAFPDAYPRYRQRVKALIPGVL